MALYLGKQVSVAFDGLREPPIYCGSPMAGGRGDAWEGMGAAWSVIGTLVAGILAWGGIGFLIDRLIGLHYLFLPIGMVVGVSTSIYLVYVRYGRDDKA